MKTFIKTIRLFSSLIIVAISCAFAIVTILLGMVSCCFYVITDRCMDLVGKSIDLIQEKLSVIKMVLEFD